MYFVYGIVKIEKYSCNKGENFVFMSHVIPSILPKCVKTKGNPKMSIVYCSALDMINNIHDNIPPGNLSRYSTDKPALPYITICRHAYMNVCMYVCVYVIRHA